MSTDTNFNGIGALRQNDNQKLEAQKEVAAKEEQVSVWEQQKADFEEKNGATSKIDGDKYAEEELTKEDYDAAQEKIDEATTAYESAVGLAETAASEAKDLSDQADNLLASGESKKIQGRAALEAANSLPNEVPIGVDNNGNEKYGPNPNKQQAINEAKAMIEEGQKDLDEAEKLYAQAQEKEKEAEQLMAEAEEYKDLMAEIQEDIGATTEGYESEGDEATPQDKLAESNKKIDEITQNLETAQKELQTAQKKLDKIDKFGPWSKQHEPEDDESTTDSFQMPEEEADPSSYDMAKKEYGEGHWVNDHTWETSDGEKIEVDNAISKKHIEEKTKHPEPEEPEDMVYYFDNKKF